MSLAVNITKPALKLRAVLTRLDAALRNVRPQHRHAFDFDGFTGVETTITLAPGWEPEFVLHNGVEQRDGEGNDFLIQRVGEVWTVVFSTPLAASVWVRVKAKQEIVL